MDSEVGDEVEHQQKQIASPEREATKISRKSNLVGAQEICAVSSALVVVLVHVN